MGTPMQDLLYDMCGGPPPGRTLKAVIPGGSSVPIMTREEAEEALFDYEGVVAAGLDARLGRHDRDGRHHRHGLPDLAAGPVLRPRVLRPVHPVPRGHGVDHARSWSGSWPGKGKQADFQLLLDLSENMTGKTICVLSDSCAAPVVSGIQKFRGEFEAYIAGAGAGMAAFEVALRLERGVGWQRSQRGRNG